MKNNDDNQGGGGGLEWGVVRGKRRGANRLFCFALFWFRSCVCEEFDVVVVVVVGGVLGIFFFLHP
jgi:hypothetical protein